MNLEQYKIVSARRIATNNLVWQTPALASAAQAFLLSSALNPLGKGVFPLVLALASMCVGMAAIQLIIRHRRVEFIDADLLMKFEEKQPPEDNYSVIHGRPLPDCPPMTKRVDRLWAWLANTRASAVWTLVLIGFVLLGFAATCRAVVRLMN